MTNRRLHVVVTGASSGIGQAIAKRLANGEFLLSLCGRSEAKLEKTITALPNCEVYSESFCLTDAVLTFAFIKRASEKYGDIDIIINCAGLNNVRKNGLETELCDFEWLMQVNCFAPIRLMQAAVPSMKRRKKGVIVNILSSVCLFSNPGIAAYTASKSALDAYTKVMRKELRLDNIKMVSVYPGGVNTAFRPGLRPDYLSADDVADAVVNLLQTEQHAHIHELVIRPQSEENYA
jgi:NADP-dependent 3-hydroxy acid dehydrogenase YdfG